MLSRGNYALPLRLCVSIGPFAMVGRIGEGFIFVKGIIGTYRFFLIMYRYKKGVSLCKIFRKYAYFLLKIFSRVMEFSKETFRKELYFPFREAYSENIFC